MTWDEACAIARELPSVEAYHGYPALRVAGMRHGDDPGDIELKGLSFDEREMLAQSAPAIFHAPNGPAQPFFARLDAIDADTLRGELDARWRAIAPARIRKGR